MISVAIFSFLVGAVLAWGFRVWILVPVTLLEIIILTTSLLLLGTGFVAAVGSSLLLALAPQFGYAFGLVARSALVLLRSPRKSQPAMLAKRHSTHGA